MSLFKSIPIEKYKISLPEFLWFALTLITVLIEVNKGTNNYHNYFLYKYTYIHATHFNSLYFGPSFDEFDNHYGPVFSILFAPFTFLPDAFGCIIWSMLNAAILYIAIDKLPVEKNKKLIIYLICLIELQTSTHNVQINPMITGFVILSYVFVKKEKDFWATLFIAIGFLIKLYGIAGLIFFFFSKHKVRFVLSFLFWMLVLFTLPMLISSPSYIIHSYKEWFDCLIIKNTQNVGKHGDLMQDISAQGLVRRVFQYKKLNQLLIMLPAVILYFLPLIRIEQLKKMGFQLSYLALSLISVVIFSSSAESPTYIIALSGVAIWYIIQPDFKNKWVNALLAFVLLLTSLSSTDLFPPFAKDFVRAYSLKALPCLLVWLYIVYQMLAVNFTSLSSYSSNSKAPK